MSKVAKILVLSFVGETPETAVEIHKQIQEECEPSATLEDVRISLLELANDDFIMSAQKPDGTDLTDIYWR